MAVTPISCTRRLWRLAGPLQASGASPVLSCLQLFHHAASPLPLQLIPMGSGQVLSVFPTQSQTDSGNRPQGWTSAAGLFSSLNIQAEMNSLTMGNRAPERHLTVTSRCSGRGTRKGKSLGQEVTTVFKWYGKVSVCEDCVPATSDFPLRNHVRKDKEQSNNSHQEEE